jgi:hypothetical protein
MNMKRSSTKEVAEVKERVISSNRNETSKTSNPSHNLQIEFRSFKQAKFKKLECQVGGRINTYDDSTAENSNSGDASGNN